MPTYDYYCPANARTLEVRHSINEKLSTWGELCARIQADPGDTPPDSPVQRLITGGALIGGARSEAAPPVMPCGQSYCKCAHGH